MSFYIGSIVFIGGCFVSVSYLQPNWGFVCCGIIISGLVGKSFVQ